MLFLCCFYVVCAVVPTITNSNKNEKKTPGTSTMVDELVILQSDPDLQSGPFQHLTKEEVGGVETSTCLNIAIFSVFTPTRPDPTDLEPDSTDVDMDMNSFTLLLRSSLRHFYALFLRYFSGVS